MNCFQKFYIRIVNSKLWYMMYYRYTKKHKQDLKEVRERVLARKEGILKAHKLKKEIL